VHPRKDVRRAFTIIELMIAMAILLALSAIVVPLSASWVRHALRAEVPDQIEGALWSARSLAGQRNAPVTLSAESSASGVRLWAIYSSLPVAASDAEGQPIPDVRVPLVDMSLVKLQGSAPDAAAPASDAAPAPDAVRLAVLLPDGTAIVDPSLRLTSAEQSVKLLIDPFALTVTLVPVAADSPDAPLPEAPRP